MNRLLRSMGLATLMALTAASAYAQVTVKDPWVRGTVAGQKATGAFMTITSASEARLVSASSPVAGLVEIHEMAMNNGTMQMRAVGSGGLALPAGKPVELKPGGYHVMLLDLKQPVKAGDTVPLSLVIERADKSRQSVDVKATVQALGSAMPDHSGTDRKH